MLPYTERHSVRGRALKAVRITGVGEALELQEMGKPVHGTGEVLVAVKAAGICHSDAHYRAGVGSTGKLPLTPGHEVAGVIEAVGEGLSPDRVGQRVCLHYLRTCGVCGHCRNGIGQFCADAQMIGKDVDGGYAEYIVVPDENAIPLPEAIPFTHGAIMMCSYATSLHALRKARFTEGESVAVFGAGGLGTAAIGIAKALGASSIFAVDLNPAKIEAARSLGAIAIDASESDPVDAILGETKGRGVDVALELVGSEITAQQAVRSLSVQGRAAMVGLTEQSTAVDMYRELIGKEREIVGVSDHLPSEIEELIELVRTGQLDVTLAVSRTIALDQAAVNRVFEELDRYSGDAIRTVIEMQLD